MLTVVQIGKVQEGETYSLGTFITENTTPCPITGITSKNTVEFTVWQGLDIGFSGEESVDFLNAEQMEDIAEAVRQCRRLKV